MFLRQLLYACGLVFVLFCNSIWAAQPNDSSTKAHDQHLLAGQLLPSNPIVSIAFFDFQQALIQESERRRSINNTEGDHFLQASMALFGVESDDFAIITKTAYQVTTALKKIENERDQMIAAYSRLGHNPPLHSLREIDQNSQHLIISGMIELEHALSLRGKVALQKYLREDFAKHVSTWHL